MTGLQLPAPLAIDPYAVDVLLDPLAFHEALRLVGPVAAIEAHGVYAVGGFDEAAQVLRDWNVSTPLRKDRMRVRVAFEEGMRMETPFQVTLRVTLAPTELGGVALEADRKVGVYLGAANRDPRRWDGPARFDASRNTVGHLGFGAGDHNCIGQMMARMEAECLLGALLERVRSIERAGPPVWRPVNQMRTLDTLPLRLALR